MTSRKIGVLHPVLVRVDWVAMVLGQLAIRHPTLDMLVGWQWFLVNSSFVTRF